MTPPRRRLRWFAGVRARSTAAAVVVVALALAVGATVFVVLLQRALIAGVQDEATGRAAEVAARVRTQGVASLGDDLPVTTRGGQLVQVVDPAGTVVASSSDRALRAPLSSARPADGQVMDVRVSRVPLLDDDSPYLVVVAGAAWDGSTYRVVVAGPITAQQQSVQTALSLLVLGLPLLVLLVGVATWMLVGRALAPVERMRSRLAAIGGSTVEERLPVPSTDDEIARLAVTMNQMLERLDHAGRTQRRFVADASHELRSPLATLAASVEVARADPTGRSWAELSPVMADEVARMGRLVGDLLLLARVDEHDMRLALHEVDLDDLVDDQVRRLRAHPRLRVEADVEPTRVVGDRERLAQVLTNLADNAAVHATGRVRLSLHPAGEGAGDGQSGDNSGAVVVVEDDGPGVPVAERERVFERFVRLDDRRRRASGGSGLGLAIVREVVRAHGGDVRIADAAGGGCRIEVTLPPAPPVPAGQPPSAASR